MLRHSDYKFKRCYAGDKNTWPLSEGYKSVLCDCHYTKWRTTQTVLTELSKYGGNVNLNLEYYLK